MPVNIVNNTLIMRILCIVLPVCFLIVVQGCSPDLKEESKKDSFGGQTQSVTNAGGEQKDFNQEIYVIRTIWEEVKKTTGNSEKQIKRKDLLVKALQNKVNALDVSDINLTNTDKEMLSQIKKYLKDNGQEK